MLLTLISAERGPFSVGLNVTAAVQLAPEASVAPHDVVVTHLLGPRGQELYAWQWYWINGSLTASDVVAKARLIWLRLTGRGDDAASIIIYTATREGQDPSPLLQSFTHDAWPAIASALTTARASR